MRYFLRILSAMPSIDDLFRAVDAHREASKLSEARLATLMLGSGQSLTRLKQGADIGVRRLSEALQWLSDHWPDGAVWPPEVSRPPPCRGAVATAEAQSDAA
jgi:hypothetical protein